MEHRTVGCVAAGIVPALHAARESLTLADAGDVHQLARFESFHQHAIANLRFVFRLFQTNFAHDLHGRHVGLLEVSSQRLVHALRLHEFHQTQLRRVVAILRFGASLHHNTRARLKHRATYQVAVFREDLRHAQLDTDNSVDRHFLVSLSQLASMGIGCVYRKIEILACASGYPISDIRYLPTLLPCVPEGLDFYVDAWRQI